MARTKPLTYQEKKILVFNKMKQGLTLNEAWKEVQDDIASCIKNSKKEDINVPSKFKEAFKEIKNGKRK